MHPNGPRAGKMIIELTPQTACPATLLKPSFSGDGCRIQGSAKDWPRLHDSRVLASDCGGHVSGNLGTIL